MCIRDRLHIATEEPQADGSVYHTLRRHVEASLERLQTDYVDLYYLHRVNPVSYTHLRLPRARRGWYTFPAWT